MQLARFRRAGLPVGERHSCVFIDPYLLGVRGRRLKPALSGLGHEVQ
jgi:hypothetical protein